MLPSNQTNERGVEMSKFKLGDSVTFNFGWSQSGIITRMPNEQGKYQIERVYNGTHATTLLKPDEIKTWKPWINQKQETLAD